MDAVQASRTAQLWDLPDLTLIMLATGCRIGDALRSAGRKSTSTRRAWMSGGGWSAAQVPGCCGCPPPRPARAASG
jgi:hypothetical protein